MSLLNEIKNDLMFLINKKRTDEYEELKNKIYDKLRLWRYDVKKEDVTVILDYKLCVGNFGAYTIYINNLGAVSLDELIKIKNYSMWSIHSWVQGIKIHCVSDRVENQTKRALQNFSNVRVEK